MTNLETQSTHPVDQSNRVPRVLSVGQCGYDSRDLSNFFMKCFGAETIAVDTLDEAMKAVHQGSFNLVLVNRLLDSDGSSGLELVRLLTRQNASRVDRIPVMLVSNYAEIQHQAEAIGALPGFGKAGLVAPTADLLDRLRTVLG